MVGSRGVSFSHHAARGSIGRSPWCVVCTATERERSRAVGAWPRLGGEMSLYLQLYSSYELAEQLARL